MLQVFGRVVFAGVLAVGVVIGCGSEGEEESPAPLPSRDGPRDGGGSQVLDAEPSAASCTGSTTKVSDTPACDTCAKQKCCDEIKKCEKSAACKALEECLATCADSDFGCQLACSSANSAGSELLQEVGGCAQTLCKTECPAPPPPDFGDAF